MLSNNTCKTNGGVRCTGPLVLKPESHICQISENSWERWVRMGEQVMCGSMYSYILAIRHYGPDTFSALPNLSNWRIHMLKISSRHYWSIYATTSENVDEYSVFTYSELFSENWHMCESGLMRNITNFCCSPFYRTLLPHPSPATLSGHDANSRNEREPQFLSLHSASPPATLSDDIDKRVENDHFCHSFCLSIMPFYCLPVSVSRSFFHYAFLLLSTTLFCYIHFSLFCYIHFSLFCYIHFSDWYPYVCDFKEVSHQNRGTFFGYRCCHLNVIFRFKYTLSIHSPIFSLYFSSTQWRYFWNIL